MCWDSMPIAPVARAGCAARAAGALRFAPACFDAVARRAPDRRALVLGFALLRADDRLRVAMLDSSGRGMLSQSVVRNLTRGGESAPPNLRPRAGRAQARAQGRWG